MVNNLNDKNSDVSIALTFDFDSYTNWIGSIKETSLSMISRGEFGPIGTRRILNLLGKHNIKSTFFIPGGTATSYPEIVKKIHDRGHEIGHHGWMHEDPGNLKIDEERKILERGIRALFEVLNTRPRGYRSPSWDNSPNTVKLLLEYDFEYESSLMAYDYEPYWCRAGDQWSKDEPIRFGSPTSIVEMPVAWHLDDWPWLEYIPGFSQGLKTPSDVLEIWKGEFDYLYHERGKGILILTMHPQCIGRGHRLLMLEDFIKYVSTFPGVKFTRCIDYVRNWRNGNNPE